MKTIKVFLVVLLVGMLGCSDDSLVNVLPDEEEASERAMALEDQRVPSAGKHLPPGQVEPVLPLPQGDSPEGIILDNQGNIYVSVRRTTATSRESEILKITPGGTVSLFTTLPPASPEATGALGLGVDPSGTLYVAHVTGDPATHGVYRIRRNGGGLERLAGSGEMIFPNAITFDDRGAVYVTDSFGGAVWRYGKDGQFSLWVQHPLLESVEVPGAPFPIPGANGIVFFPPNKLYVANTSQFSVVRIVMAPDGSAGEAELVAQGLGLLSIDGLAVDVHENVYGVLAASNAEETGTPIDHVPPLVKVNPGTGEVAVVLDDDDAFDAPTSLAFGRGRRDHKNLFIANSALFGPVTNGPGGGVVQVGVGAPGLPFQIDEPVPDDDMTLFVGEYTFAPDPAVNRVLRCLDATGTLVPDLTLPERFVLEGRIQHLGRVTGYFGGGTCLANADFSLTVTRDWRVTAPNGEALFGTYTATVLPDGSFTSEDEVRGGIGRFAGATGRGRSVGSVDLETGEGTLYTKGLVSAPKEVVEMGFVVSLSQVSESGSVSCLNSNGDQVFAGTRQFAAEGLATYLGEVTATIVNDRCLSYEPGVLTFYGSTTYTGRQGDAVYATYTVLVGVGETWPNASIITGGSGRFEGVTGWMNGEVDPAPGGFVADLEGVLFMPR